MKLLSKVKNNETIHREFSRGKGFKNNKKTQNKLSSGAKKLTSKVSFDALENGTLQLTVNKKKIYVGVLSITGMDIEGLKDYEKQEAYNRFARASLSLKIPHKYFFTYKTPNLSCNKSYVEYKKQNSINKYAEFMLDEQYKLLDRFEREHYDKTAYLFLYGEDARSIDECASKYICEMEDVTVLRCGNSEVEEIYRKIMSLDGKSSAVPEYAALNDRIIPPEIEFHQDYYMVGDRYAQTVVVHDYPASIPDLLIKDICRKYNDNVILEICRKDESRVLTDISNSLSELESRGDIVQTATERIDTQIEYEKLNMVYNNIKNGNEQICFVTLRILVSDTDKNEVFRRSQNIIDDLKLLGLSAYIPVNLMFSEFLSTITNGINAIETPFPVYDTLAPQYPFYHQQHLDSTGFFWGFTKTGGLAVLDTFLRTRIRNSYDLLAIGIKGGGKSVTLKALLEDQLLKGNKVLAIDIEDEYYPMAEVYDGQIIKMNGNSRINPLQIMKAVDAEAEDDVSAEDENKKNFTVEISRIRTFMKTYLPDIQMYTLEVFMDLVVDVLAEKGIFPETDVDLLPPEAFPTFSDVLRRLRNNLKKPSSLAAEKMFVAYSELEIYLKQLTGNGAYAGMFDGATNVDVRGNKLVVFNVKALSEMAENVYNAQLFNILSIMWSEVCRNQKRNNNLVNPWDRSGVVCLIDEAHRFISTKYPQVTQFILNLVRRSRKYISGLWFATQSILDFVPGGDLSAANDIKIIFSLVQYKLILKQSSEGGGLNLLSQMIPQFTETELRSTTAFVPGEMLISLGSGRNRLHIRKQCSAKQLLYMGNNDDRLEIIHNCFEHFYNEYSKQEYALMLRKTDINYFRKAFTEETYSYLNLSPLISRYLDSVINTLVDNLIKELLMLSERSVGQ